MHCAFSPLPFFFVWFCHNMFGNSKNLESWHTPQCPQRTARLPEAGILLRAVPRHSSTENTCGRWGEDIQNWTSDRYLIQIEKEVSTSLLCHSDWWASIRKENRSSHFRHSPTTSLCLSREHFSRTICLGFYLNYFPAFVFPGVEPILLNFHF